MAVTARPAAGTGHDRNSTKKVPLFVAAPLYIHRRPAPCDR